MRDLAALGQRETDWAPYSFTMNWRFTRPDHPVRFEENEPFAFIFPLQRGMIEAVKPRIRPIDEAPELKRQFETWSHSRDGFQAKVAAQPPSVPSETWQKAYYRGVDAEGAPGTADHRAKLRLAEFDGAEAFHRETPAICPAAHAAKPKSPATPAAEAKLEWLFTELERLRALSPASAVPRRNGLSAEAFLEQHYAANWPALMPGEVADWPAVRRWSPAYLKAAVGAAPVQAQTGRASDPDFERNMAAHAETLAFDAFIDRIAQPGAGNDAYVTAYNSAANAAALSVLHRDLGFLEQFLNFEADHAHGMFWIGPAGTFTPLHHDLTNNLLLQLVGRKCVLMAAPGETPKLYNDRHVYSRIRDLSEPDILARCPKLDGLRVHRIILGPGDALFVPLGWWHQVTALDFSVTVTHTNFRWPNEAHASYPHA